MHIFFFIRDKFILNQLIATTLETLLNQALRWNPSSSQTLQKLSGKIIRIESSGIELTLFPDNQSIIVLSDYHGDVDVCISGAPFTLLRLLLQDEATLSNNPDVTITGEMSVAQQLLHLLKELDIDWEEQLAQRLGDIPAHKLGTLFRQCQNYTSVRLDNLQHNISEYLQEETRHLPTPPEMETFLNAVDTLRDDLERLEQRVRRLT
ncbi:MAG: SCP2 sterol-binding domain-containing protein [Pseudomonadota bacterium]